jgi:hypothetical protein
VLSRRAGGLAVAVALAGGLLSACDRPVPQITLFADRTTTRVNATTYCFDSAHCRQNSTEASVAATAGSTILVDVPRQIANAQWLVSAYTVDSSGKKTVIDGAGSSLLHDTHTVRLLVPTSSGAYALSIQSFDGTTPTGIWNVVVQLRQG